MISMYADDPLSNVDAICEQRDEKPASTEAVPSAANDRIDQPHKGPVVRRCLRKSAECQKHGKSVDVGSLMIPPTDTAERHLEHRNLQGSTELTEDGFAGARDENAEKGSPALDEQPDTIPVLTEAAIEALTPTNQGAAAVSSEEAAFADTDQLDNQGDVGDGAADQQPEMSQLGTDDEPDASWDLDRLGAFITGRLRRTAADAWWIGKALHLARTKHTEKRKWRRWLRTVMSKSSAYRFLGLYEGYTLEQVRARPCAAVSTLLSELSAEGDNEDEDVQAVADVGQDGHDDDQDDGENDHADNSNREASPATSRSARTTAADEQEETEAEPPQPQISDAEYEAMHNFVQVCGGWTRAEYVLSEYRQEVPSEVDDQAGAEDVADE